jgi:uncharacterized protein YndB with AHSA1/START domain
MIIPIAVGAVALIGAGIAFVNSRPTAFRMERSADIDASPEVVFRLINDFHHWEQWSPWEKLDPNLKRTFTGPTAGEGAGYGWVGNKKAGEGRMTISESRPGELVSVRLEFIKPFPAVNQTYFRLTPAGSGTRVVWSMEGKNSFMMKAFSAFMNMDELVGKDFESGLANLGTAVRSA